MASLSRRYADALLAVTEAEGSTPGVEKDLLLLGEALESKELRAFLENPAVPRGTKAEALVKALAAAGGESAHPRTRRFLEVLLDRGRIRLLPELCARFHELALEARGEAEGELFSHGPMETEEVRALEETLTGMTGKKVRLRNTVDRDLLGGFVIRLGDRMFDASLKGRIQALGARLKGLPVERLAGGGLDALSPGN